MPDVPVLNQVGLGTPAVDVTVGDDRRRQLLQRLYGQHQSNKYAISALNRLNSRARQIYPNIRFPASARVPIRSIGPGPTANQTLLSVLPTTPVSATTPLYPSLMVPPLHIPYTRLLPLINRQIKALQGVRQ